ncbi:MAG: patatin-like phospholipase family protein, partial [Bacillota bacterium]
MTTANKTRDNQKVLLALQGGGAHSAYVWGVVDCLLQEGGLDIAAVSGTSGGAMIAAVLAYGLSAERDASGRALDDAARRAYARELLDKFWARVAQLGDAFLNPYRFTPNPFHRSWNIDGLPVPIALNALSLVTSPYQSWGGPRQNP